MFLSARSITLPAPPAITAPAPFATLLRAFGSTGRTRITFTGVCRLVLAFVCTGAPAFAQSGDECIPSPEDGIFCGEDPGGGPFTIVNAYSIYGDAAQEWNASIYRWAITYFPSTYLGTGARLSVSAVDDPVYSGHIYGGGSLRILSGTVRFLHTGTETYGWDYGFTSLFSGNTYAGGTEIAGGKLIIGDDAGLGTGALQLTGTGALETWYSGTLRGFSVAGDATLLSVPNQSIAVSGIISGEGRLNLAAANGQVTLTGVNTHTHGTSMSAGKLVVGTDSALGAADSQFALTNGATLTASASFSSSARELALGAGTQTIQVGTGDSLQWNGVVTGDGALAKTGAGTLTLAGADSTFTGGLLVSAGTVRLGADQAAGAASGSLTVNGSLDLNGFSQTTAALSGTGSVTGHGGTLTLDSSANTTLGLALTGTGNFTKTGSGTLTLAGANALFEGTTTVAGGTLRLTHSDALANTTLVNTSRGTLAFGSLTTANVGALGGAGNVALVNENDGALALTVGGNHASTTFSGALSGTGSLTKIGSGTLTLSGAASHTGFTTVSGGTLRTGAANALSADSALFIIGGTTVDLAGHDQTVGDLDSYNFARGDVDPGTLALGGATLTTLTRVANSWAGAITGTGNIVKQGAETAYWRGANTFTGNLAVNAGTLLTATANTLSATATISLSAGATLDLASHEQTVAGLSGPGTVALGFATLTVAQSGDTLFSGTITGIGGLAKSGSGTLVLSGVNTYYNDTLVGAGRLIVNGSATLSAFTVNAGATLGGSGTIGALTIASGGMLSPGNSPGTLTAGNTTFESGGKFEFEINDTTPGGEGTKWDLLSISGQLFIQATAENPFTLDLVSLAGFDAGLAANFDSAANYSFTFLTTTEGIGGFAADKFSVSTAHFQNPFNGTWSVSLGNSGHDLTLNYAGVSAVPEPSTYALLAGGTVLALAFARKRCSDRHA